MSPAAKEQPETYYDLLRLKAKASALEAEIAFRQYVARYRVTTDTEHLFTDPHFTRHLNAYLTLHGPSRAQYDAMLARIGAPTTPPAPLTALDDPQKRFLMARIAFWRRENAEAIHLLRTLLSTEPNFAPGWALLGEVFLTVGRLDEGIDGYEHAVAADPNNARYAARLQHARDARADIVELEVELSPEEELLRHERRTRMVAMLLIGALGLAIMVFATLMSPHVNGMFMSVPWPSVGMQALGIFILLFALGYGRALQPFEHVMLWSGVRAGDRGRMKSYPSGLLVFVTGAASLWLALLSLAIMAFMEEEWPISPSVMMGICILAALALTYHVYLAAPAEWISMLLVGGNVLVLAAMLGWWLGSLGAPSYE